MNLSAFKVIKVFALSMQNDYSKTHSFLLLPLAVLLAGAGLKKIELLSLINTAFPWKVTICILAVRYQHFVLYFQ
jgi:hypothetical protein